MTDDWITIEGKRVNRAYVARYYGAEGWDGEGKPYSSVAWVEMASGKAFVTKLALEELDKLIKGA